MSEFIKDFLNNPYTWTKNFQEQTRIINELTIENANLYYKLSKDEQNKIEEKISTINMTKLQPMKSENLIMKSFFEEKSLKKDIQGQNILLVYTLLVHILILQALNKITVEQKKKYSKIIKSVFTSGTAPPPTTAVTTAAVAPLRPIAPLRPAAAPLRPAAAARPGAAPLGPAARPAVAARPAALPPAGAARPLAAPRGPPDLAALPPAAPRGPPRGPPPLPGGLLAAAPPPPPAALPPAAPVTRASIENAFNYRTDIDDAVSEFLKEHNVSKQNTLIYKLVSGSLDAIYKPLINKLKTDIVVKMINTDNITSTESISLILFKTLSEAPQKEVIVKITSPTKIAYILNGLYDDMTIYDRIVVLFNLINKKANVLNDLHFEVNNIVNLFNRLDNNVIASLVSKLIPDKFAEVFNNMNLSKIAKLFSNSLAKVVDLSNICKKMNPDRVAEILNIMTATGYNPQAGGDYILRNNVIYLQSGSGNTEINKAVNIFDTFSNDLKYKIIMSDKFEVDKIVTMLNKIADTEKIRSLFKDKTDGKIHHIKNNPNLNPGKKILIPDVGAPLPVAPPPLPVAAPPLPVAALAPPPPPVAAVPAPAKVDLSTIVDIPALIIAINGYNDLDKVVDFFNNEQDITKKAKILTQINLSLATDIVKEIITISGQSLIKLVETLNKMYTNKNFSGGGYVLKHNIIYLQTAGDDTSRDIVNAILTNLSDAELKELFNLNLHSYFIIELSQSKQLYILNNIKHDVTTNIIVYLLKESKDDLAMELLNTLNIILLKQVLLNIKTNELSMYNKIKSILAGYINVQNIIDTIESSPVVAAPAAVVAAHAPPVVTPPAPPVDVPNYLTDLIVNNTKDLIIEHYNTATKAIGTTAVATVYNNLIKQLEFIINKTSDDRLNQFTISGVPPNIKNIKKSDLNKISVTGYDITILSKVNDHCFLQHVKAVITILDMISSLGPNQGIKHKWSNIKSLGGIINTNLNSTTVADLYDDNKKIKIDSALTLIGGGNEDKYFDKYLKYKAKYIQLRKQLN